MVDKTNNETGSNDAASDSTKSQVKKRPRIFGARKKRADEAPAVESAAVAAPITAEPAAPAAADVQAEAKVQAEAETVAPEAEQAEAAPAEEAAAEAAAEAPAAPVIPTQLSTTSLIFHAPVIAPLPARSGSARGYEHDYDRDADDASTVRRRARRRSGEESRSGSDDPANTVVKVRTPREPELITEPQRIKGSTRLEAKKQRRRDGRDAGRRRTVITEAEFLARRESVDRSMVVRAKNNKIQIGVLEDGVLVEHYVAKNQEASLIGNVYLGRVQNVLPSMEAAFIDIGRGRNAVLYSGEVDWDAAAAENPGANQPRRIELALKPGDKVLVQVTKDPVGHKGARLTSQVSLPGRYLVYVPNGSMNGISRKLPDTERSRLKKILKEVLPDNVGVIVRTAAEGATEEQLTLDVQRLISQWASISSQLQTVQAPALLHSEPDLLIKIVRDVFNEDFQKMIISGDDAQEVIESYLRGVAPDLLERVERYEGEKDAFDEFRISEQIEKALDRKVWLPSGGSLVIDRTEAMTVVDVNTGKFVGSGGNLEETVTKNNLEAAEEIVRQLRLRDIGGIIVVDFIDMVLESNRDLVSRRLIECLSRDRTKHQVAEVTSLGLVQMTRKKLGLGLLESFSENCEVCAGRGIIVHHDPVVKHRQTPQQAPQQERRRSKGAQQPQQQPAPAAEKVNGTHGITADAKNALAQIAASTLAHPAEPAKADEPAAQNAQQNAQQGGQQNGQQNGSGEPRSSRSRNRKSRSGRSQQPAEQAVAAEPAAAAEVQGAPKAEAPAVTVPEPIAILDIPVAAAPRQARTVTGKAAEELLGSVLEALPEPKQPGQGRSRSRRVSTAALSTTPVVPIVTGTPTGASEQ
ncbi:Rne/Rng family ribonuclease [Microterricola pindariensis]|uniref:Ribonuclease E/G n=1 Tax=Microterricola pindariensis TaxID=478010 RepID=A0ABX5B1B0_9MICO|nr:Rne/Rng family ribonuclease [Microterricola pindariensis]PPL20504.1 ribonuclease E/G [Microterricola pindariensis]